MSASGTTAAGLSIRRIDALRLGRGRAHDQPIVIRAATVALQWFAPTASATWPSWG